MWPTAVESHSRKDQRGGRSQRCQGGLAPHSAFAYNLASEQLPVAQTQTSPRCTRTASRVRPAGLEWEALGHGQQEGSRESSYKQNSLAQEVVAELVESYKRATPKQQWAFIYRSVQMLGAC